MLAGSLFKCTGTWEDPALQLFEGRIGSEKLKAAGHPNGYPNNMTVGFDRKTVRHGHSPDSGR